MRFLSIICRLLAVSTAHAATARIQPEQEDQVTHLLHELDIISHIFARLEEVASSTLGIGGPIGTSLVESNLEVVAKLIEDSTLKCRKLNSKTKREEAFVLYEYIKDLLKPLNAYLRRIVALKEAFGSSAIEGSIISRVRKLEKDVNALGHCFKTHTRRKRTNYSAKYSADLTRFIHKIFESFNAQLTDLHKKEAARIIRH